VWSGQTFSQSAPSPQIIIVFRILVHSGVAQQISPRANVAFQRFPQEVLNPSEAESARMASVRRASFARDL
jgi:hypothetical protein